ncbi:phosphopantetheine-binding protein [[Ruminococcus] torques]|uniref:phosphopantetheine-binding protein n=1 Tax=[Ruminococcus] torques TaxID=33039 RepID=UPI00307AAA18
MERLMKILEEARPDIDFVKEDKLIDGEVLDSFDIISIIMEINDVFKIEIDPEDLEAKHFNSAEAIWKLIQEYARD